MHGIQRGLLHRASSIASSGDLHGLGLQRQCHESYPGRTCSSFFGLGSGS